MLLRIIQRPSGTFEGIPLDRYQVGGVYEVEPQICGVLLLEGWAEPATYEQGEPVVPPPPAEASAPVVLIVDDEPEIRKLAELVLKNHGYRVQLAPNGEEAIRRLKESPPDVILLDLTCPSWTAGRSRAEQKRLAMRASPRSRALLTAEEDGGTTPQD